MPKELFTLGNLQVLLQSNLIRVNNWFFSDVLEVFLESPLIGLEFITEIIFHFGTLRPVFRSDVVRLPYDVGVSTFHEVEEFCLTFFDAVEVRFQIFSKIGTGFFLGWISAYQAA